MTANSIPTNPESSVNSQGGRLFVFVITYGRSGSTVLMRLLNTLDGYHIKGENWNTLLPLYRSFRNLNSAHSIHGDEGVRSDGPWWGVDKVNPDRFARRLVDTFVEEVIQPPEDARVLGFKEVRYFQCFSELEPFIAFMRRFCSPCKFVFNSRPADAVMKSGWWANMNKEKVRQRIHDMDAYFADYAKANGDHAIHLDYEHWSRDINEIRRLVKFLEEPFDEILVRQIMGEHLRH